MNNRKKVFLAALLIFAFCLSACGKTASVTEIPLGEDLPVWMLGGEYTAAKLPKNAEEQNLVGVYTTDSERADVYVYRFPGEDDIPLEEFGQQQAAERNVFCNMLTDRDVPAAVLNYYESGESEHDIVQAYIYKAGADFIEVSNIFKTELIPFACTDLSIRMIREYDAREQDDSPLVFDTVYLTENDRLPMLRIRQFSKNDFPADVIEPDLIHAVSDGQLAALAENGWTREEILSLYEANYDLLKGEVMVRNDLPLAFIGYVDDGIFKTRAFIDDGTDYVLLSAEAEASRFQHVTNALIDAIEKAE